MCTVDQLIYKKVRISKISWWVNANLEKYYEADPNTFKEQFLG